MGRRGEPEALFETLEDPTGMNRRDFIQTTAALSAGLLAGAAGVTSFPEIGYASAWTPASFPKLLLYNCQIFDGVHRQLQKDRVVVVERSGSRLSSRGATSVHFGPTRASISTAGLSFQASSTTTSTSRSPSCTT